MLSEKGFLDKEDVLNNFSKFGSKYIGHPNNKLPGIEMNSGSLGHGLPVCVGMAKAAKMDHKDRRVYVPSWETVSWRKDRLGRLPWRHISISWIISAQW